MMNTKGGVLALTALILFGAGDVRAQDPDTERRPALARAPAVERIMAMRERLELTDEQIAALDGFREEAVAERNARRSAVAEMRSRLRAGQIRRSEMMAFMEELRDNAPRVAEERRGRIESILGEAQIETLRELRRERTTMSRGRRGVRRDPPGVRGRRGVRQGRAIRGPRAFGPRMGRWDRGRRGAGPPWNESASLNHVEGDKDRAQLRRRLQ